MDCRKFQRNLEDYLEGGLDFPGRFGMERHAQQCFVCGKELSGALKLSQEVRALRRVSAPPDFEAAVLERIHARGKRSRFGSLRGFWVYGFDYPSWRLVALGASALAIVGFVVLVAAYRTSHDPGTASPMVSGTPSRAPASPQTTASVTAFPESPRPVQPEQAGIGNFAPVAAGGARKDYAVGDEGFFGQIEPSEYVEYVVPGPGDRPMIVRLPKTIRMRYGQPSEDYYIRNVSH